MNVVDEYLLQEYQDLGPFEDYEHIRLKRHPILGKICLEKHVSIKQKPIYDVLSKQEFFGVPTIYACIEDDDELIVIEKYIEGKSIETLVKDGSMDDDRILSLATTLCDILEPLHSGTPSIICRDLKAENIMVDDHGMPWIVDFDIARIYQEGKNRDTTLLGTAEYAAPEQFGFFQTDGRTDIYALGVLINYMKTGKFPVEQMVDGQWGKIVETCTFLDPAKRYQHIGQLKAELMKIASGEETLEKEVEKKNSFVPPGFRKKKPLHIAAAVFGYYMITLFSFSLEMNDEGVPHTGGWLRFEQITYWIFLMMWVFVGFNYRGWRNRIPLMNSKNIFVRGISIVASVILFLLGAIFTCALAETLFH